MESMNLKCEVRPIIVLPSSKQFELEKLFSKKRKKKCFPEKIWLIFLNYREEVEYYHQKHLHFSLLKQFLSFTLRHNEKDIWWVWGVCVVAWSCLTLWEGWKGQIHSLLKTTTVLFRSSSKAWKVKALTNAYIYVGGKWRSYVH